VRAEGSAEGLSKGLDFSILSTVTLFSSFVYSLRAALTCLSLAHWMPKDLTRKMLCLRDVAEGRDKRI